MSEEVDCPLCGNPVNKSQLVTLDDRVMCVGCKHRQGQSKHREHDSIPNKDTRVKRGPGNNVVEKWKQEAQQ